MWTCVEATVSRSVKRTRQISIYDNQEVSVRRLTNDGLDGFVDVVVDVLVGLDATSNLLSDDGGSSLGVVVQVSLFLQLGSVFRDHVMLGFTGDFGQDVEFVLGVQDLLVNNGLNSVLVVVNVSFTVNGLDGLDSLVLLDVFLDDFRGGFRADLSAMNESKISQQRIKCEPIVRCLRVVLGRSSQELLGVVESVGHFEWVGLVFGW